MLLAVRLFVIVVGIYFMVRGFYLRFIIVHPMSENLKGRSFEHIYYRIFPWMYMILGMCITIVGICLAITRTRY